MIRTLLFALAVLVASPALGQEGFVPKQSDGRTSQMVLAGWEAAIPIPELYERVEGAKSYRGAAAEARFGVALGLTVGAAVTWNRFSTPGSAPRHEQVEAISPRATVHYYPLAGIVQPYIGVGAGGVRRSYTVESAGIDETGWGWCVDPQLGVLITGEQGLALNVMLRYQLTNASLASDVPSRARLGNPSWVGITVGLGLY